MSDTVIHVESLGKQYRLGATRERYQTLRDQLSLRRLVRRAWQSDESTMFWALKDVSFEVRRGEVLGIIGRNGAGKSTLLKVLSRITEPTEGSADIYGRVGSLLEVGTGFHPELTGRENIFLNGAILGMRRAEIVSKFDEIVAFAEVEKFIDTPTKHYSSGMYMRLAFSVAAHLEPEILIIDEVLAVGDAEFQKKCLGKMGEVAKHGRTVLFVSHSMLMIQRLCSRAILLQSGRVVMDDLPGKVIHAYTTDTTVNPAIREWDIESAPASELARLRSVRVVDESGAVLAGPHDIRRPFSVEVAYEQLIPDRRATVLVQFVNSDGLILLSSCDFNNRAWWQAPRQPGMVRVACSVPGNFLAEGQFSVIVAIYTYDPVALHAVAHDAVAFQIVDPSDGDGVRGPYPGEWVGAVRPMLDWDVKRL